MGFLLPAAVVIILDQIAKQFFWHLGKNFDVIDGILRITLVKNPGAAFGVYHGGRTFFVIASVLASILVTYIGLRTPCARKGIRFLLGLILGGAIGNLIDRVLAGEVIDFIDMGIRQTRWPVYNIADMAVTIGAAGLVLVYAFRRGDDDIKTPEGHAGPTHESS
ncbi:MAG: signal peptidase II [Candidatus Latescibacterota bacterium]